MTNRPGWWLAPRELEKEDLCEMLFPGRPGLCSETFSKQQKQNRVGPEEMPRWLRASTDPYKDLSSPSTHSRELTTTDSPNSREI